MNDSIDIPDETADQSMSSESELEQLRKENKQLKAVLNKILPSKASMKGKEITWPIGYVIAADNSSRGSDFIETIEKIILKNQYKIEECHKDFVRRSVEDQQDRRKPEELRMISLEKVPRKILQVFPTTTLDKSLPDIELNKNKSISELLNTLGREERSIRYEADDDMVVNNLTKSERQEAASQKIEDAKEELAKLKMTCFNCGKYKPGHKARDCPLPFNQRKVNSCYQRMNELEEIIAAAGGNEKKSIDNKPIPTTPSAPPKPQEKSYSKTFSPGKMSDELYEALGIDEQELPPWIYAMREIGYPAGWLRTIRKQQEKPLQVIEHKHRDNQTKSDEFREAYTFDTDKLISYEGYNIPASSSMEDHNPSSYNEKHSLINMKKHLNAINIRVTTQIEALINSDEPAVKKQKIANDEGIETAEDSYEEKEDFVFEENRQFTKVTADDASHKGLPSLTAFSKGVADFHRNMVDLTPTENRGRFKKLRALLKRKHKA